MPQILRSHYVLAVHDVDASASYYMTALGFREVLRADGWRFVSRYDCLIMLGECPDALPARDL